MGDESGYKSLTDSDLSYFNWDKTTIDKQIREKFPSIPANFELVPVVARDAGRYPIGREYKVALPDNKFVKVSLIEKGRPGDQPPEVVVADTLTSTADE